MNNSKGKDEYCGHRGRYGWQSDPCGNPVVDGSGLCKDHQFSKDEVGERLDAEIERLEKLKKHSRLWKKPSSADARNNLNLLKDIKAERDTLKSDNEVLRHKPGINLCSCKSIEDCDANSDAADEWCRVDYNSGIFEQALQGGKDA